MSDIVKNKLKELAAMIDTLTENELKELAKNAESSTEYDLICKIIMGDNQYATKL